MGTGLSIQGTGSFTNTITNNGTISGVRGVLLDQDTGSFTNTITNGGTIQGTTEAGLEIIGTAEIVNSGAITGVTGIALDNTGADSLTNTGAITGTGGTAVDMAGGNDTVELGTGTAITGIVDGGDGTDTMTFSGTGAIGITQIANFEAFSKEEDGTWTLTGTGSLGADVAVNGGMLAVAGTLSDDVTVGSLGGLMGSGTVVGSVTNSGRVAPGNSIGTLTIDGDYTHAAGAVYEVEVNADGESDLLNVTGNATIEGGTVSVLAEEGSYEQSTDYLILHADGSLTGTFDTVTSNLAFLDPTLSYSLYNVTLTLDRNQTSFLDIAQTYNQIAVAEVLDEASLTATGDTQTVIDALMPLTAEEARLGFDQMGGAVYTAFPMVDVDRTYRYMRTLFHGSGAGRLPQGEVAGPGATRQNVGPWGLWIDGQATYGERDGDDIASRFDYRVGSAAFGADYAFSETFRAGLSVGYADTQIDYDDLCDEGDVDSYQVALYGVQQSGPTYLEGALFYGYNDYEMTRQIDFGTLEREARGDYSGYELAGYFEAGYKLLTQGMEIRPMASIFALSHHQDGFSETGADAINIEADSQDYWSLKSTLGVGIAKQFGRPDHFTWRPQALVGWVHEFGDDRYEMDARYADVPADEYNVRSDSVDRDSALLGVGVTARMGERTQLVFFYDALVKSAYTEHALTAGLGYVW